MRSAVSGSTVKPSSTARRGPRRGRRGAGREGAPGTAGGAPQAAADDVGVSDPFAEEGSEIREQTARFRAELKSGPGHGSPYQPPLRDGLAGSSSGTGGGSVFIRSSLLSR